METNRHCDTQLAREGKNGQGNVQGCMSGDIYGGNIQGRNLTHRHMYRQLLTGCTIISTRWAKKVITSTA